MEEIVPEVRGRGRPSCTAWAHADGVRLRLDDGDDPAFWAEVELSERDLRALLAAVVAAREAG